jgi:hypothetical protein
MKILLSIASLFLLALVSCSKNKYTTKPQITIVSIGPDSVSISDIFKVDLHFTDKEGDIHDSLYMHGHVLNQKQQGNATEFQEYSYTIPDYPDKIQGDFQLMFSRQLNSTLPLLIDPQTEESDTILYSFNVKDSKGNLSDTVKAGKPIIILNH